MSRRVSDERKREVRRAAQARYRARNKDKLRAYQKRARAEGRGAIWQSKYYRKNRERLLAEQKVGDKLKRKRENGRRYMRRKRVPLYISDPERYAKHLEEKSARWRSSGIAAAARRKIHTPETKRIYKRLSWRLHMAVKLQSGVKSEKTKDLLGMNVFQFRDYIEALFQEGMSWDNYGEWELDHKRPVASFDLTKSEQQKACFNYTNFQPLWKLDNRRKATKLEWTL